MNERPLKTYRPRAVASALEVDEAQVAEWIASGRLSAVEIAPGVVRVLETDLLSFLDAARLRLTEAGS